MIRKSALALVIAVGAFWLVSTVVLGYHGKTKAVDELTEAFRPTFSDAGIAQAQGDMATINAFAAQFQGQAVPALARQLKMTPDQLIAALSAQYPAVGAGVTELPTSLPYFARLVDGLAAQQGNFQSADEIPTSDLPTTTVHWLFVGLGGLGLALGIVGLASPRRGRLVLGAAAVLGVGVIGASLVLGVPSKARAVDDMTDAFRPLFTSEGAAQTRGYLENVTAMNSQLAGEALPGLATMLGTSPTQLSTSLTAQFPAVATGLKDMPAILARFDGLTSGIEANLATFRKADSVPTSGLDTSLLQAQLVVPAALLVLVGGLSLLVGRRRDDTSVDATTTGQAGPVVTAARAVPAPAIAAPRTEPRSTVRNR